MSYIFACEQCALVLDDGVDYAWCPACGGEVREVAAAHRRPASAPPMMTAGAIAHRLAVILLAVQSILALVAPDDFPYLGWWLRFAQITAGVVCVLALL